MSLAQGWLGIDDARGCAHLFSKSLALLLSFLSQSRLFRQPEHLGINQ